MKLRISAERIRPLCAAALIAFAYMSGCGGGASSGGGGTKPADVLTITSNAAINCIVGVPFSETLTASGNSTPIVWSVVPAHPLPPGLALIQPSGTISGTPTLSQTTVTTIVASDGTGSASKDFTFSVADRLTVAPVSPKPAHINAPYSLDVQAFGGVVSSWTISRGQLPPGLSLVADPSLNSLAHITGKPAQTGTFSFTVQAQDNTTAQTATLDLAIAVDSHLAISKGTLKTAIAGVPYSDNFNAVNGTLPYHWSITGLQGQALTLDGTTGNLSGTPTVFAGTSYVVTVIDSGVPQQMDSFSGSLVVLVPLSFTPNLPPAYINKPFSGSFQGIGGLPPYTFTISAGSLPLGLTMTAQGFLSGRPSQLGSYDFTVQLTDSATPTNVLTQPVNIKVTPTPVNMDGSPLSPAPLNVPYHSQIPIKGGTPPYTFSMPLGSMPPGLTLNLSTGSIDGTPTQTGAFGFQVQGTDSSNPTQSAVISEIIFIRESLGRNDTIATATPIGNSANAPSYVPLSISPYIDPIQLTVSNPDTDFYRVVASGGSIVHVETFADRPLGTSTLDTVIEILAQNGTRMSACTAPSYTSSCLNDDIDATTRDSALDVQVPGAPNAATTMYIHVLDWRGDARPDMLYSLNVSGVIEPLTMSPTTLGLGATRGVNYQQQFNSTGGKGNITWTLDGGALPSGWFLSSTGLLSGVATTDGSYSFAIKASDSTSPPQTARTQFTLLIADPVTITTSPTFPNACLNKPYSFQMQTSGGLPPINFGFTGFTFPGISLNATTGVFSGSATATGTFSADVGATDSAQPPSIQGQHVTLNIVNCP